MDLPVGQFGRRVLCRGRRRGAGSVRFEWDEPPPLLPADERFYLTAILPDVIGRLAEYQERPEQRRALYLRIGAP